MVPVRVSYHVGGNLLPVQKLNAASTAQRIKLNYKPRTNNKRQFGEGKKYKNSEKNFFLNTIFFKWEKIACHELDDKMFWFHSSTDELSSLLQKSISQVLEIILSTLYINHFSDMKYIFHLWLFFLFAPP